MDDISQKRQSDLQSLPHITFRQLEIFSTVCHEQSFANTAMELHTTRATVKRTCAEFEKAVGRELFVESDGVLKPTDYAKGMLGQMRTLSRSLKRLEEKVRSLHQAGRILRFAAADEFFRGGLFTDFLARLQINNAFRPCFLKIDSTRYRNALLNAECDVYFGIGLLPSDHMDLVDLGPVPWIISWDKKSPPQIKDLQNQSWAIVEAGDHGSAELLLERFRAAGASNGEIIANDAQTHQVVFRTDITPSTATEQTTEWPNYRFTAALRKHHPYSDLKARLESAALL
jgi:DNA-binding transcriptional LysR family regulator